MIEHAWRCGARFDGWDECFNNDRWTNAFDACGIDKAFYAHRERSFGEVLPWSHLNGGPSTEYLENQYNDVFVQLDLSKPVPT